MRNYLPCLLLSVVFLAACAGRAPGPLVAPGPSGPAVDNLQPPPDMAALPALDSLDGTARSSSVAGPGWHPLDLSAPATAGLSSNAVSGGNAIDFDSTSSLAWRVFGVGDFRNDFKPTSIMADVVENDVPYFLGHADFLSGRWELDGPFLGDSLHEYGSVDEYSDPSALVSPFGLHYVAIVVPEANFLQLDGLSLGIHGGDEAPLPVLEYQQNGGPDAIHIQWLDSPSALDADFAGYSVQRSPFLSLEWTDLTSQLQHNRNYSDEDVLTTAIYRYRVNTHDLAGNVAFGLPFPLQTIAGNTPPVANLSVARGPHFGPVDLTLDMSASFDPDGDPITGYSFEFGSGMLPVSQPGPVLDVTLQPGNYVIHGTVDTAAGSSTDYVPLVVYPQWQDTPYLIDNGTESIQRAYFPWTVLDADGQSTTTFYHDALTPGITAMTIDAGGVVSYTYHSSLFDDFQFMSEPVRTEDGWAFAVVVGTTGFVYLWDGEKFELMQHVNVRVDGGICQLVTDDSGGIYFMYYDQIGAADWTLKWFDLVGLTGEDLVTGLASSYDFDCDWNEAAGAFDAVYVSTALRWVRFLPGVALNLAEVSPTVPDAVELDIDPATGRPGVIFRESSKVNYASLNPDNATWSTPEIFELTSNHGPVPQLIHADGNAYAAVQLTGSGKVLIFENDGTGWADWNTHDDDMLGESISLGKLPGEEGLRLLSQHDDGSTRMFSMRADGSQELLVKLPGVSGAGLEMTCASSSTGLHVLQRIPGNIGHWSSTDAQSWTSESVPGLIPDYFELGSEEDGAVYLAYTDNNDFHLDKWDGVTFSNVTMSSIPSDRRPLISDEGPYKAAWEDSGGLDFNIYQSFTGLIPQSMAGMPIWDGSMLGGGFISRPLVFYGGADLEDAAIGYADIGTNKVEHVADIEFPSQAMNMLKGRGIDGASFLDPQLLDEVNAWHVCTGPDWRPLRVVRKPSGEISSTSLDAFSNIDFGYPDLRRSSSAAQANGNTFVGLTAANLGSETYMEWSRFGEFEELPLPDMPNMSLPDLMVGHDGRWHIIYRDYVNDDLMVISTL